jgi:hypothetical protein
MDDLMFERKKALESPRKGRRKIFVEDDLYAAFR